MMNTKIELPDAFVFMKVGNHAGEEWEQIVERKQREIEAAGKCFWGYGGVACHPLTQVQPFVKTRLAGGGSVGLLMEKINSMADPDLLPATHFSVDGVDWEEIPKGILVTGSRYALVLGEIVPGDLIVPMSAYEVAVGPSRGRSADDYLTGRVDKGCFVRGSGPEREGSDKTMGFAATLIDPFAVLLKGG